MYCQFLSNNPPRKILPFFSGRHSKGLLAIEMIIPCHRADSGHSGSRGGEGQVERRFSAGPRRCGRGSLEKTGCQQYNQQRKNATDRMSAIWEVQLDLENMFDCAGGWALPLLRLSGGTSVERRWPWQAHCARQIWRTFFFNSED